MVRMKFPSATGNRYEVDASITDTLTEKGLRFTGFSAEGHFPEVFEMQDHPFYVGVIYHPEFISRPNKAHPCSCPSWALH